MIYPSYTVAIRTLGKSGDAFRTLIHSLEDQEVKPSAIHVYIAEGYSAPSQVGGEFYFTCPKGLATQRALPFEEIDSDYILFLDDDLYLPPDTVKKLFDGLLSGKGDCIGTNIYPNHHWDAKHKWVQAIFYSTYPSFGNRYAFRIRRSSYYSYSSHPAEVMPSQSCAGACMLMKTEVYHQMDYHHELWLDKVTYATGQDQVFAYKLYRLGYILLVHYNAPIVHLDAQSAHLKDPINADMDRRMVRFLIWYRTIYESDSFLGKGLDVLCFSANWVFNFILCFWAFCRGKGKERILVPIKSLKAGIAISCSKEFRNLPAWKRKGQR